MTAHVVLIDNYDSFTYNLFQSLSLVSPKVSVFRNDRIGIGEVEALRPDYLVISPGPKTPDDAGISKEVIRRFAGSCPILGVCLGHQCINEVFGGRTIRSPQPWHGKTSLINHDGGTLFEGLPQRFAVMRYHSLVADRDAISPELEITAWTDDGLVMGLRHRRYQIEGVQFHPESFLTEHGETILRNFLTCRS